MTAVAADADVDPSDAGGCPLLGMPDDSASRFSFPNPAHRCWASGRPHTVDHAHQGAYCLAAKYPECSRYKHAVAAGRPGVPTPEALGVVLERVRAQEGVPAGHGHPPPRRWRRRRVIAVVVLAGVVLAGAAYVAGPWIVDQWNRAGAPAASPTSPAAAPSTTPIASPTPSSTPTPVPSTPKASATPNASATPSATPAPTPVPSAEPPRTPKPVPTPRVHVVTRGETLTGIAAQYGVTVAALRDANGIRNPNLIHVGDHLVIPRP